MAMGMSPMIKITLVANDGMMFSLDPEQAFVCLTIRDMYSNLNLNESCEVDVINADGMTLAKVVDYCMDTYLHYDSEGENVHLTADQRDYLGFDVPFVCQIMEAANFLHIPGLIDLTAQHLADCAQGRTISELRMLFNLPDDLSPEVKADLEKKYDWFDV